MGVSPWLLGGVICALLCVTTMQYFFAPPMKNVALLGGGAYEEEGLAFWGAVDAEFDWCESNYEHQILEHARNVGLCSFAPEKLCVDRAPEREALLVVGCGRPGAVQAVLALYVQNRSAVQVVKRGAGGRVAQGAGACRDDPLHAESLPYITICASRIPVPFSYGIRIVLGWA
jgi:hypothetical protein